MGGVVFCMGTLRHSFYLILRSRWTQFTAFGNRILVSSFPRSLIPPGSTTLYPYRAALYTVQLYSSTTRTRYSTILCISSGRTLNTVQVRNSTTRVVYCTVYDLVVQYCTVPHGAISERKCTIWRGSTQTWPIFENQYLVVLKNVTKNCTTKYWF